MPEEQELISTLQTATNDLGRPPTPEEVAENYPHEVSEYEAAFGDWDGALSAAGLLQRDGRESVSREELLADLRLLADQSDSQLTEADIRHHASFPVSAYVGTFGSVKSALAHVNADVESEPTEELKDEMRRLEAEFDRPPYPSEMRQYGRFQPCAYREVFGDWNTAVERILTGQAP